MWIGKRYRIEEVAKIAGIEKKIFAEWIQEEWIRPCEPGRPEFDEEDLARAKLIRELIDNFGVNAESIPIILSLLDQIHCLRAKIKSSS